MNTHYSRLTSLLLLVALSLNTTAFGTRAQAQRERRAVAPTPTPSATATPQTTPTPAPIIPAPQATPMANAPKSVEELRARIQEILGQPQLAPALYAIKVASLDTGRVLFEENAGKLLTPASNMKMYTVSAALDRLTPDFRFVTSVYAAQRPDAKGTVHGDLVIYGRGDPTFATRFNGGDYYKAIDDLAARIVAAGVKRVDGDLIGDESYFTGPPLGAGWEWDDLQWYYGAEVSALTVDDNSIDLFVKPGAQVGAQGVVTSGPTVSVNVPDRVKVSPSLVNWPPVIENRTRTTERGTPRQLSVERALNRNVILVSGNLPLDDAGYSGSVAITNPAMLFVSLLRASLVRQGVQIKESTRTVGAPDDLSTPLDTSKLIEIARRESPPFSEVAAQTLKPSQNLYTELILRTLGKKFGTDPKQTSAEAGIAVVKNFLREAGVNPDRVVMQDGSGLARQDLVTAESSVQLLTYMSRHRYANIFRDALPIAGVDGTLRTRMKGTPAAGNLRAKTGTLANVASLSGYVTTAAGEHLVFSLMLNHQPAESDLRRTFIDTVAILLASFSGHS